MSDYKNAVRASFVIGICAAALAAGCSSEAPAGGDTSSDDVTTSKDGTKAGLPALEGFESFHPQGEDKVYYSGYDGTNDYVAPLAFFGDKPPTVTFGDPSIAELNGKPLTITKALAPDLPDSLDGKLQLVMVKSKKAGETTVTATLGKITSKVTLKVTKYTTADVEIGQKRYEEGSPACVSCHANLGVHNPTVLADLSDDTILGIAVDGKSIQKFNTETNAVETLKPNKGAHKWTVTEKERTGLMAYLRSRDLMFQMP